MYSFFYRSELVEASTFDEDGRPDVKEFFYVMAEDEKGRRWAHNYADQDEAVVAALLARISAAGEIDLDHWQPAIAAYGSVSHEEAALYDEDDVAAIRQAGGIA